MASHGADELTLAAEADAKTAGISWKGFLKFGNIATDSTMLDKQRAVYDASLPFSFHWRPGRKFSSSFPCVSKTEIEKLPEIEVNLT